jgi:hypothetical protein
MRSLRLIVVLIVFTGSGCAWQQLFSKPTQEEQVEALVRTIDYSPDPCHCDYTPSVWKLIEIGEPAIPRMLDLMLLDGRYDQETRFHAKTVLWRIILNKSGFGSGQDWNNDDIKRVGALWESLGDLDYKAPLAERERAVKLWREWLAKNKS